MQTMRLEYFLRFEYSNNASDKLSTDRALVQDFSTRNTAETVAAFQKDTLNCCVHANLAQIVGRQLVRS